MIFLLSNLIVTLGTLEGLGSKMHSPNVPGHFLLCGESLGKESEELFKQQLFNREIS